MRSIILALATVCTVAPAAMAQDTAPSAAMAAMRDRFEAEVLAVEGKHGADIDGLRRAALQIAQRVYGSNWHAVRTETRRSLAALPAIDLAPYSRLKPAGSTSSENFGKAMTAFAPSLGRDGLAMMRFWDAQTVAFLTATTAITPTIDRASAASQAMKMALVPMRAYRGRLDGVDVLATRYLRSLVIAPYSLTADGLILPDFARIRVYPLQP